jgi:predicted metal-dependent HD superfamily phosphohydrolase
MTTVDAEAALSACGLELPAGTVERLRGRYGEPLRAYHSWKHIEAMLAHAEAAAVVDRPAFLLAILYHDAVYDPRRGDNEAASADLMRRELTGKVAAGVLDRAKTLVLATHRHALPESDDPALLADAAIFLDIDLAVLGADAATFATYDAAIRQEYAHVPEADYRAGRRAVLERFLMRPRLYLTDTFFEAREQKARANLTAAIARLSPG